MEKVPPTLLFLARFRCRSVAARDQLVALLTPLCAAIERSEPHTLTYQVLQSDQRPDEVLILERFRSRADMLVPHKQGTAFLEFKRQLDESSLVVEATGSSWLSTEVGFAERGPQSAPLKMRVSARVRLPPEMAFERLAEWSAPYFGLPVSVVGQGVGAIREMSDDSGLYRERLLYLNSSALRFGYCIDASPLPTCDHTSHVAVFRDGDGSRVVWEMHWHYTADDGGEAALADEFARDFTAFIGTACNGVTEVEHQHGIRATKVPLQSPVITSRL